MTGTPVLKIDQVFVEWWFFHIFEPCDSHGDSHDGWSYPHCTGVFNYSQGIPEPLDYSNGIGINAVLTNPLIFFNKSGVVWQNSLVYHHVSPAMTSESTSAASGPIAVNSGRVLGSQAESAWWPSIFMAFAEGHPKKSEKKIEQYRTSWIMIHLVNSYKTHWLPTTFKWGFCIFYLVFQTAISDCVVGIWLLWSLRGLLHLHDPDFEAFWPIKRIERPHSYLYLYNSIYIHMILYV